MEVFWWELLNAVIGGAAYAAGALITLSAFAGVVYLISLAF